MVQKDGERLLKAIHFRRTSNWRPVVVQSATAKISGFGDIQKKDMFLDVETC